MKTVSSRLRATAMVTGLLIVSAVPVAARDLVITHARTFASLDGSASDDDCTTNGVLTVNGNLMLDMHGSISGVGPVSAEIGGAGAVKIVVRGNMEMRVDSAIRNEDNASGHNGGEIDVTVGGKFLMRGPAIGLPGARISAIKMAGTDDSDAAGSVVVKASGAMVMEPGSIIVANGPGWGGPISLSSEEDINIGGRVLSQNLAEGINGKRAANGSPITVKARSMLTVADAGSISSGGANAGADLVHLEAADVVINGVVQSLGSKRTFPNHLSAPERPDKPDNSIAGVEVWGSTVAVNGAAPHHGEVSADATESKAGEVGWIDLISRGNLTITGNDTGSYAVHANERGADGKGGLITAKAVTGKVATNGLAIQANATEQRGIGGRVTIEAGGNGRLGDINLGDASVQAKGAETQDAGKTGGQIIARSFSGRVYGQAPGEISAAGAGASGKVSIASPGGISYIGNSTPKFIAQSAARGGMPATQSYQVLPSPWMRQLTVNCSSKCSICRWCNKGSVLTVVDQNMGGNCDAIPDIVVDVRLGTTSITLENLGTFTPATGSLQSAVDYINANGDINGDGFLFIAVTAQDCDSSFNSQVLCQTTGTTVRPLGGDTGFENVVVTNTRPQQLNIFGCSTPLTAKDPSKPVITITDSVGPVEVLDIHAIGSNMAGYLIKENTGTVTIKNMHVLDNNIGVWVQDDNVVITGLQEISGGSIGVRIDGDNNTMRTNNSIMDNSAFGILVNGSNNDINDNDCGLSGHPNGVGLEVDGDDNDVHEGTAASNTGDGVRVTGNGNTIHNESLTGNGGIGIKVNGAGNLIDQNEVYLSGSDGFNVAGGTAVSPNTIQKNDAGDRNKGNSGNGLVIGGVGNGINNTPIEINQNTAVGNTLNGILVTGTDHQLKNNISGGSNASDDNGDCEFSVVSGNFNATGNKANNVTVPGANDSAFPSTCLGTP